MASPGDTKKKRFTSSVGCEGKLWGSTKANGEGLEGKAWDFKSSHQAALFLVQTPLQRGLFFFFFFLVVLLFYFCSCSFNRKITSSVLAGRESAAWDNYSGLLEPYFGRMSPKSVCLSSRSGLKDCRELLCSLTSASPSVQVTSQSLGAGGWEWGLLTQGILFSRKVWAHRGQS